MGESYASAEVQSVHSNAPADSVMVIIRILDKTVNISHSCKTLEKYMQLTIPPTYGYKVGQTGLFNLG